MKKLLIPLIIVFAVGCSTGATKYDNNEYELLARLETTVRLMQEDCPTRELVIGQLPTLIADAELLHTYTFYIPRNTEVFGMVKILRDDIREFEQQYNKNTDNPLYCKLKTKAFLAKVRRSLEAVGKKIK